jgi:TFIIF-interacting CTD phosphatase-like protein
MSAHIKADQPPILVFDLDETLVFATLDPPDDPDFVLELLGQQVYVRVRAGVPELLALAREISDVRVWSTGQPIYVDAICEKLGISDVPKWGRDRCRRLDQMIVGHHEPYDKPLDWIHPDLSRIAIIDNSPGVFACNAQNGIPIDSWRGDRAERQLDLLGRYLRWLVAQPDLRRDHREWSREALLLRNAEGPRLRP